ncbi:MAG: hypothetical protein MI757_03295 [Pirellulales bacterium]|nr:hypothetical protein [Pirellulales bacterium]
MSLTANQALEELLEAVEKADDEVLMMSRKHCHARHVSSIVVSREGDRLRRAFIAWPGHQLHTNRLGKGLAVGIHDHRYDLSLKAISGDVCNTIYVEDEKAEHELNRWRFSSNINGDGGIVRDGTARVRVLRQTKLIDDWLHMSANVLHNVDCYGPAAWWVDEGRLVQEKPNRMRLWWTACTSRSLVPSPFDYIFACSRAVSTAVCRFSYQERN